MAITTITPGTDKVKIAIEELLIKESAPLSYFEKFVGDNANSIIERKSNLTKDSGQQIDFQLVKQLTGAGVSGRTRLKGKEEQLVTVADSVTIEIYRHAVSAGTVKDKQLAPWDIDATSRWALSTWVAQKRDSLRFDALFASPNKVFYRATSDGAFTSGSAATAKAALSATNSKLTLGFVDALATWGREGGGGQVNALKPIKTDGGEYLVFLCTAEALYDLKQTSEFQTAMREARERGKENPLFHNATAIWNDVVFHTHRNCPTGNDGGGASVRWSKAALLGAQSLIEAEGMRGDLKTEVDDYGFEKSYGWQIYTGVKRPVFDSKDYNCMIVNLANSAILNK